MVVNMMWRMRQQTFAVVGSVKRQIVRAQEIIASGIEQVVAVTVYHQSLPVESIFFARRQRQVLVNRNRGMQRAAHESGFYDDGKLDVKIFGDIEGTGER